MEQAAMTRREKEVYDYILSFRKENQVSPTIREIMHGLNLYSSSTVHKHVHMLVDKGWLREMDRKSCSVIPIVKEN